MENKLMQKNDYSNLQKLFLIFAGALLTGAMWRARGSHGWGSSWGVLTVALMFTFFVYAVFKRKTNASFFQIVTAGIACMLTTPAWGTLVNQTSGYFTSDATPEITNCTQLSGVFIMLCLGFGAVPLFAFVFSRIFSNKQYKLIHYILTVGVFFAVFYIANATVSHFILKLVQPESVNAFQGGIDYVVELSKSANITEEFANMAKKGSEIFKSLGDTATPYSVYMKHFSSINWAKKIPYGRNYFTEIAVISHAIASLVTVIFMRFGLKDKTGSKVTLTVCSAFAVGICAGTVSFVLRTVHPEWAFLSSAWSIWEFLTGFIAGLIIMSALFSVDKKAEDKGFKDDILPFVPEKIKTLFYAVYVFAFGICFTIIRPFATRLDDSDVISVVAYAVLGVAALVITVLMLNGKLPKLWEKDVIGFAPKAVPLFFGIQMFIYFFVGNYWSREDDPTLPAILEPDFVLYLMIVAVALFFAFYFENYKKLKKDNEK